MRALEQYRNEGGDAAATEDEAWNACKGLFGMMDVAEMLHLLRDVYGDARVRAAAGDDRKAVLRQVAKRRANIIRRALQIAMLEAPPPPAFVVHPPPPPHARSPPPVLAINQAPPARAPQQYPPPPPARAPPPRPAEVPSTFDALRVIIAAEGNFNGMVPDEVTPVQIAQLFSAIDDRGECPICLTAAKLHPWTYDCGHRACHRCFGDYAVSALKGSAFPVKCPGGCGGAVDPRLVLDVLGISANGAVGVPEAVLRFASLQLSVTCAIDPETAGERVNCPACRTVVCGRPSRACPMARCTNPFCATRLCTECKTPWHDGKKCEDNAEDDAKTAELLAATAKPCPHCGRMAGHFRNHACHHLTCPCGHQYCYECMEPWSAHTTNGARRDCRIFCWDGCHCVDCPECKPGLPCKVCTGCGVCRASV